MRNLCGLTQPTISRLNPLTYAVSKRASGYAFACMEIGSSNAPDGLAVVLTSMTITRFMPEVILVGGNLMEVFLKIRNPYSSSESEKE